ncbi:YrbL family protein [Microbulbifer bruguierae]|uniref:YrbL family protein n=1 Tax=Microbulbifer bruguierae TaxID=3029061 RepID=A0ABY8NAP8_9GAMM|nr:YrbL family protein [Microbulbifer bruguierae]WGL15989.1 YrbL family protein [Microbulbifer bruguierae]
MIDLRHAKPFAAGGNRNCYRHPQYPQRCIKVMLPGRIAELRRRAPWYKVLTPDSHFDDNAREQAGYRQKALKKASANSPVWAHLPKWYGLVETSEGTGAVSELLTDGNDIPAMTLETYLQNHGLDQQLCDSLERFSNWLRSTGVLTKNLLPHNLVLCQRNGKAELYLVDGLGNANFLPISEYFAAARRRYIERRIEKMWKRIRWEISDRDLSWKAAERL